MSGGTLDQCQNCGHRLRPWDKFCSQCGQDTLDHPPSLWEFVHEFLLHYVAFEGKLWKSLWSLLARPGFLTAEYLAGRKQRYVLPLRLVLTLGLVFFMVLKLTPVTQEAWVEAEREVQAQQPAAAAASAASAAASAAPRVKILTANDGPPEQAWRVLSLPDSWMAALPAPVRQSLDAADARLRANPNAEVRRILGRMLSMAPYAVLVSLPFFAALLKLLYWRQSYGAHFVFAMHLHAAWYGMLLIGVLFPVGIVSFLVWAWANLYPLLALRRVHGAGWGSTVLRAGALALLHWLLISLALLALVLLGALA